MDISMLVLSHPEPPGFSNPNRSIINWYDLLTDPFSVIKKKCKPTIVPIDGDIVKEEVFYLASLFTEDKINSPSFADEKDTVLNNIILDSSGELLQMYFMTNNDSTLLSDIGMFKIHVREHKRGKEVVAREFLGYLQ